MSRIPETIGREEHYFRNKLNIEYLYNLKWEDLSVGKRVYH